MKVRLGINCGFAINRYVEPEVWTQIVGEKLGLRYVQFVADLLNPFLPVDYIEDQIQRINKCKEQYNVNVESIFTSAFTRVNCMMHPDGRAREIWTEWFEKFFNIGSRLGAKNGGGHFGILTFNTFDNEIMRKQIIEEGIKGWQKISKAAKKFGYQCLIFEPMSVPREMANTVEETLELMERVNENSSIPMRICLDAGHAPHPSQRDPYVWLEKLGKYSPIVHIQQTELNRSNHWPFIPEYNEKGIIQPERVLEALEKSGAEDVLLLFEIYHREHWDTDRRVIDDLKSSVEYWRRYVPA